ncbi:MAG TPA: NUDIX domain-containing protein [Myxococcota bacterium]|nr:NUDIX domain-containing protein [Myxococcota bacterium]
MPAVPARNVSTTYFATDPTEVRVSVCVVVRRGDGSREILLMRRSDNAHWGLPGGYVEPGESVIAAAAREVREETGFEVEIGRLVGVYSDPKSVVIDYGDRRRVQAINLCFEGVAKERGEATTPHETLDVGFFEVAALPRPFVPIHEIRVQDAERGDHAVAVR